MPPSVPSTGFLSVVVERQPYGLLITFTVNPDVADPAGDRVTKLQRLPDAIAAVTAVLTEWHEQIG